MKKEQTWFTEDYPFVNAKLSIKITQKLHSRKTPFQKIDVYETSSFGKMLVIDELIMFTEKDEFIYHEMITHVAMNVHPNPQRVLVIGGGDGGTLRELLPYQEIKAIDLVDIDKAVLEVSEAYFPKIACGFHDRRVAPFWENGVTFIKNTKNIYDIIIIDSTDPIGPGEELFTDDFYRNCFHKLKNNGILINQSESPQWTPEYVSKIHKNISNIFPIFKFYQAFIPTYPSGHWLFGFASKTLDPISEYKVNRLREKNIITHYYNEFIHYGAFALPNFLQKSNKP